MINSIDFLRNINLLIKLFKNKLNLVFIDTNSILVELNYKDITSFLYLLKNISFIKYNTMSNIFCIDTKNNNRYILNYSILSTKYKIRLFVKVNVPQNMVINTVSVIHETALWLEREVFDFFGIFFICHKDLRRILTDYGFDSYALRKNYPISGFVEVAYDIYCKNVIYCNILLTKQNINIVIEKKHG
jgi:NADH:ubiquinone oxidoreductase subunit C